MSNTIWKTHPVYTDYEVSNTGRVRSKPRIDARGNRRKGQELAINTNIHGYRYGNVSVNGKRIHFTAHVFVCETFHGLRPEGMDVRHLNGERTDNRAENLVWGTKAENMQDKILHGRNHELNKTHCKHGHKFTEENIYRAPSRPNKRACRECRQIHQRQLVRIR